MPRSTAERRTSTRRETLLSGTLFVVDPEPVTRPGLPVLVKNMSRGGAGVSCAVRLPTSINVLLLIVAADGEQRIYECQVRSCAGSEDNGYRLGLGYQPFIQRRTLSPASGEAGLARNARV